MGKITLTGDSYIRKLPFSTFKKLMTFLDPGRLWEKMIIWIPKKLDMSDDDFEPRYTYQHVTQFEFRASKQNGSATESILADWATQNAKVKDLIKVLVRAELFAAADYLSVNILNEQPVPRPSDTDVCDISTRTINNLDRFDLTEDIVKLDCKDTEKIIKKVEHHSLSSKQEPINTPSLPHKYSPIKEMECKTGITEKEETELSYGSSKISDGVLDPGLISDVTNKYDEQYRMMECMLVNPSKDTFQNLKYDLLKMITNNFDEQELPYGGRLIGRGGFGNVYLGNFRNNFQIAIKCLKIYETSDKVVDVNKHFETELNFLSSYRHINLIQLLGMSNDGPVKCIIYQYMPNGSLEDRLQLKYNTPPLKSGLRVSIAQGSAEGIAFLNNSGVVHRDIKSANILLDSDFIPKVSDFATTRYAPQGSGLSTIQETNLVIGTAAYLAPEAHSYDVSAKLDSYSFGVVLLELLTGLKSFDPEREERDIKSHVEEHVDYLTELLDKKAGEWNMKTSSVILDVATRCLEHKKKKRPTVSDILEDLQKLPG